MKAALEGWKTYLVSGLIVIVSGLHATGYLTMEQFNAIMAFLVGLAGAALRHGQTTEAKKVKSEIKAEIREEAHKTREASGMKMQEADDPSSFRDAGKKPSPK